MRALQLFNEMLQQGLESNLITYIVVSSACRKCRMPNRALQLFDEILQQGLEPKQITYTAVVKALEKAGGR